MLSREGNRFTALKAGATRITYTVGGQSASFDVVIRLSALPDTGQNTMWLWLTGGASITALITALLIGLHRRQRAEFIL
jgi:LPXTG-motif cell wall-anchored protein